MNKKTYKQPICKVHEIKMSRIYMGDGASEIPIGGDVDPSEFVKERNDNDWEEF